MVPPASRIAWSEFSKKSAKESAGAIIRTIKKTNMVLNCLTVFGQLFKHMLTILETADARIVRTGLSVLAKQ
jgi:hypothetical protein